MNLHAISWRSSKKFVNNSLKMLFCWVELNQAKILMFNKFSEKEMNLRATTTTNRIVSSKSVTRVNLNISLWHHFFCYKKILSFSMFLNHIFLNAICLICTKSGLSHLHNPDETFGLFLFLGCRGAGDLCDWSHEDAE